MYSDELANLIELKLGWKRVEVYPRFLKRYNWVPMVVFSEPSSKLFIAVDIIFKQNFPKKIYQTEVIKALKENSLLRFCLFTPDLEFDVLSKFCLENKIGLKNYSTSSINTLVPFFGEKVERVTRKKIKKTGWFPQAILEEVKKVRKIHFAKLVVELANKLEKNQQEDKQFNFICKYIDKIMKADPSYVGSSIPLLNLSYFENILKNSSNKYNDHVFHSARVFLIGCIIIDRFYDDFVNFYKEILGLSKVNVEYIWLLASLFHDIGRIQQEGYRAIYLGDSKKDDQGLRDALEESQSKKWQDDVYKRVLGNLVELIKQCNKKKKDRDRPFIGYALGGVIDPQIANILKEQYNKLTSHGVISCFELSTDLLRKIDATTEKHSKVFFLYHLFPAALAIAFHDWKIWKELSDIEIFPINIKDHPLAALLIYIDTWDDYKRGQDEKITIDKIEFSGKEVTVYLTWHKQKEYLGEKLKYDSFERNVLFSEIRLKIEVSNKQMPQ
jgi:hypothetical protein